MAALARDTRRTVIVLADVHSRSLAQLVLDLRPLPHLRLVVESSSRSPAHRLLSAAEVAELDLDQGQWRDQQRFEQWQASAVEGVGTREGPAVQEADVDLSDPVAVCQADPWLVTTGYENEPAQNHGGLRDAWLRVGQSLCHHPAAPSRALTLLTALSDSADPRLAPALSEVAESSEWHVVWSRVRGDLVPPWPGPVTALGVGRGPLAGSLLVAGPGGIIRSLVDRDASSQGRLSLGRIQPQAVAVMADGTVLVLDGHGRAHADASWVPRPAGSGIAALLDSAPSSTELLMGALRDHVGISIAYAPGESTGTAALGDSSGAVHICGEITDSAVLHRGRVTALASVRLPFGDVGTPVFYSGGADGTVRVWAPGSTPMREPLLQRPCPVVSMDAVDTENGPLIAVAWADGEVECVEGAAGIHRMFRPGPPVRAVALASEGRLVIGMDESVVCLAPRTRLSL
ncbi:MULTISPECIES: hypothetical protein [unclassified Streptomyces]|uniref:hypothetical protein n=1 Tax=unclassified Streptomyces TaxID=2593676 RepID=UPI00081D90AF|nr:MULTISPECIES: hypothetical protein [unclassified Streptomyces]SCD31682.1 hypothetical protein GA0115243_100859 [Streptomyces sp. ScaeMP-e83]